MNYSSELSQRLLSLINRTYCPGKLLNEVRMNVIIGLNIIIEILIRKFD